MTRRTAAGEYVSPYQGLYANRTHWQTLTECERSAYMVRALASLYSRNIVMQADGMLTIE